ncbi:MAG: ABC transporter permease [Pirellulales bacterium]
MILADIRVVLRLVLAHLRQHPGRVLLTLVSVVTAASIVVWVVSGYDSLVSKFDGFSETYLGRYGMLVVPAGVRGESGLGNAKAKPLDPQLLTQLATDPDIVALEPAFQTRADIRATNPRPPEPGKSEDEEPRRPGMRGLPGSGSPDGAKSGKSASEGTKLLPGEMANPYHSTPIVAGGSRGGFSSGPTLVGTDATEAPNRLVEGRWFDPRKTDAYEAAISKGAAEQMRLQLGDKVTVSPGMGRDSFLLTIVGIVEQTKALPSVRFRTGLPASRGPALERGPARSALYVPLATAEEIVEQPAEFDYAGVVLKPDIDQAAFAKRWKDKLAASTVPAEFQNAADVDDELNSSSGSESMRMQAYSATGISLLAALFIIFTTLSMGVHERIRQFAVLRAVALTKSQVAGMIFLESLLLGLIGWGGGILAGWALFKIVKAWQPEVIVGDNPLGTWCILLSGLCALGGSMAASILPAWRATRVSPLEAMNPQTATTVAKFSGPALILGLLLISINPLVVFVIPMADTSRYGVSAALGCTTMAIGFILLAPAAILGAERIFGSFIARLLGLNPKLLASQLGTNLWRTLGTTIALSLGLGLFVAMQTWGYSMLAPFYPGEWAPDLLIGVSASGIPIDHAEDLATVNGLAPNRIIPLAIEQTKFADDVLGADERANAARQDNCVFIGVDPDRALSGKDPIFNLRFVEGNREDAIAKLKSTRSCLVPDHFAPRGT